MYAITIGIQLATQKESDNGSPVAKAQREAVFHAFFDDEERAMLLYNALQEALAAQAERYQKERLDGGTGEAEPTTSEDTPRVAGPDTDT